MKIIKYLSLPIVFGLIVISDSCNPDKLNLTNPNQLQPETFFTTENQVKSAVNAIYGSMQTTAMYNRHIWFGNDNMAHENAGNPQLEADKRQYLNFDFDYNHGAIGDYWESCYRGINKANFVINNKSIIDNIPEGQLSPAMKAKYDGEAKFMRAMYYFWLVTKFGDCPLVLEVPSDIQGLARSPVTDVWAQIESDFTDATTELRDKADEELGRATKGAAWGMLGKAQLFQKKYAAALASFNNVTGYSLEANYENNFLEETEHGPESLFEVEFNVAAGNSARWNSGVSDAGLNESCFRGQEYGCMDWFNVFPSINLTSEFEAGDPRYGFCFYVDGEKYNSGANTIAITPLAQSDGSTYPRIGWKKYQNYYKYASESTVSPGQASGINMKVLRYADVLLMRAECKANTGDLPGAVADMNIVRARPSVNMPLYGTPEMDAIYPVSTTEEFMVALEHERKIELCGEQVRFSDLVRWGRLAPFMAQLKAGNQLPIKEKADLKFDPVKNQLWPIPQREMQSNSKMTQNPGY
jgi:starch-binding outer membrane protein, SusD/RagB family